MSSICGQTMGLSDKEFWASLSDRIAGRRVPYSGSLALTHHCNLRCAHCYIREESGPADAARPELDTGQWRRIIDEVREAGCLNLLLTGGEPMLRKDFAEIYAYAKRSGFLVSVFTNATLVSESILALFRELPPRLVDISLYGATAATCALVTGVPGSFQSAIQAVDALLAQGTRVGLKSIMMTLNESEFTEIEALARNRGVRFRKDAAIFPAFSGKREPLDLRVTPERAVELEMSDPAVIADWREYLGRYEEVPTLQSIYACGAGITTYHVDPQGVLYPCVMAHSLSYSLVDGSFAAGWSEMAHIRDAQAREDFRCRDCRMKLVCGYCPGFFEAENGRADVPSEYLCRIGKLRYQKIHGDAAGG